VVRTAVTRKRVKSPLALQPDHFLTNLYKEGEKEMAWNKPIIQEISVGLEINSYACAEK
jgi:coenzyme PQQ precursor peptide PqqA|tara:strand:+ start:199 stop:375 length:177 start_codon:yes stop_codon:yes gene_type:complete